MSAPTTYTETTLADYLHLVLGATAGVLGWSVAGGNYAEPVNETLLAYFAGPGAVTNATDIRKLRALARREAWRAVVQATAGEHDFETGMSRFSRSQIHKQALASLAVAEAEAAPYDDALAVTFSPVRSAHDPYVYLPDEVRVLP